MDILVKTVRNFDILAVQEFRDKSMTTLPYFVEKINEIDGFKYNYVGSERYYPVWAEFYTGKDNG